MTSTHPASVETGPTDARSDPMAFGPALAAYLLSAWRFGFACDDAFISFRYARHLAEGAGFVFNPGEMPPVEGFSNLLWVLWSALWIRIGVDPVLVANATSLAAGAVLLFLVVRWVRVRLGAGVVTRVAAGLFLATLPTFTVWATSGLETMAFALCVFGVFERMTLEPERPRALGVCAWAVLASLLRVDGAAWALLAGLAGWCATPTATRSALRRTLVALALALLGTLVALAVFRLAVFGELLPNTAHVKAGASAMRFERGAKYALAWLGTLPGVVLAAGLGLAALDAHARRSARAATLFLALTLVYAVWVGGDFMPFGRYCVPATPFLALALAAGLGPRPPRARLGVAAAAVLLSLGATFDHVPLPDAAREALHFRWNEAHSKSEVEAWRGMDERARHWRLLGRALRFGTEPGESIVLGNIGAIGYESELWIHDTFGLVDRAVARRDGPLARASPGHDKGVPIEFFLPRGPTYLAAWLAAGPIGGEPVLPPAVEALRLRGEAVVEERFLDASAFDLDRSVVLVLVRYVPR